MNASFYNGVSGVKTDQFYLDTIAQNIANISTVGYKRSNAPEFSTVFSSMMTDSYFDPTANDSGLGVRKTAPTTNMSQGIFQSTDQKFDLAIGGDGWFGVQGQNNQTFYTRAGAFNVDANGDLVDPNGNYLLATSGNNITPTTLPQSTMEDFGKYYSKDSSTLGNAFAISDAGDISLGSVGTQAKVNLPDILYYPPVASTYVKYQANLNPQVNIKATQINLDNADILNTTVDTANNTISINGSINNTPQILNPQKDDDVLITIADVNGKKINTSSSLDSSLNWSLTNKDVSSLDTSNPLIVSAQLLTTQEIPNVEHFNSTIISPTGKKDMLDMTFTKEIPQPPQGSVWNADLKILSFFGKYDPSISYDPTQYQVDENSDKVYNIIDSKSGNVTFSANGELLTSNLPTMSNSGTPLNIDVGSPNSYSGFVSSVSLDKSRSEQHDGLVAGLLRDYGVDENGNVVADFDNGRSLAIAKVAIYHFQNDEGLSKTSNTLFRESANSGKPIFFTDKNGNPTLGAKINSYKLENSNVDLTIAMSELILAQRTYGASAKSITTSDQMLQNAINMKK
ncbi:MAG: flagellar hook-basal body complex protein [Campylobacteraceae bacterium]|nr:flagellar hook-basal body complex protein [Campylobacteraceae bacterium]